MIPTPAPFSPPPGENSASAVTAKIVYKHKYHNSGNTENGEADGGAQENAVKDDDVLLSEKDEPNDNEKENDSGDKEEDGSGEVDSKDDSGEEDNEANSNEESDSGEDVENENDSDSDPDQSEWVLQDKDKDKPRPILTAFLEAPDTLLGDQTPIPPRNTTSAKLKKVEFPRVQESSRLFETFPIDDYPTEDPFLPWIHDYFPTSDGSQVKFVAQNRRRCNTGEGNEKAMIFWEPQMALMQPIPVVQDGPDGARKPIRIASSYEEATTKETRFICRFHTLYNDKEYTTLSEFKFNYEYISWRKNKSSLFEKQGKDVTQFWTSQLLFHCPVPEELQDLVASGDHVVDDMSRVFLDLIPIRTPARYAQFIFTKDHVGPQELQSAPIYDLMAHFGKGHYLPPIEDSGRWANLPIGQSPVSIESSDDTKQHQLVACTWTAASYTRRGDAVKLGDTEARLREWIAFHQMVGFDHIYVYDNSAGDGNPLQTVTDEFADTNSVQYHRWPCQVCNNNRPAHKNPGERSSQYAAEASCRERYGSTAEWMAFIDSDEYLVPMRNDTWGPILTDFAEKDISILGMRSSRAKPRHELME